MNTCPFTVLQTTAMQTLAPPPRAFPAGAGLAPTAVTLTCPIVDPAALQELGSQLDALPWPRVRPGLHQDVGPALQSLANSLTAGRGAHLDAVLSLKTSSAMVGGVRPGRARRELEDAIRVRDADRAQLLLREGRREAETKPWTNWSQLQLGRASPTAGASRYPTPRTVWSQRLRGSSFSLRRRLPICTSTAARRIR